jgi:hypothetical protein
VHTERITPESLALHPAGTCDGCGNDAVELAVYREDDPFTITLHYCRPCMGDDAQDPSLEWITGEAI